MAMVRFFTLGQLVSFFDDRIFSRVMVRVINNARSLGASGLCVLAGLLVPFHICSTFPPHFPSTVISLATGSYVCQSYPGQRRI